MARKPQHANYDIDLIRNAAACRWPEILSQLGGIEEERLDGRDGPCPHCGGTDRFHAITTDDRGGAICRQCFNKQNGDGFSVLQWLAGIDFKTSLERIANYLGITPTANGNGKRSKKKPAPDDKLDFQPWNEAVVSLWALNKPPITAAAVRTAGGRLARYRNRWNVVAIPVWGPKLGAAPPVGWVLFNVSGGNLPRFQGKTIAEWVPVKVTYGSEPGLMLSDVGEGQSGLPPAELTWKLEGATDFLACLSVRTNDKHRVASNAFGTDEIPSKTPWIVEFFAGQDVVTLHDADIPGERGAMTWAATIATTAARSRRAKLPYEIVPSHGKDERDFLQEGHTYDDLLEIAAAAEPVEPGDLPAPAPPAAVSSVGEGQSDSPPTPELEDDKDPHRLARIFAAERQPFRYWRQEWWEYNGSCYEMVESDEIRAFLNRSIKNEFDRIAAAEWEEYNYRPKSDNEKPPKANHVTRGIVGDSFAALSGMVVSPGGGDMHTWIEPEKKAERRNYIAMRNGILDLDALMSGAGNELLPHDPRWFSSVCLPYEYNPDAECPRWMSFLKRNLEGDIERIRLLQEWAGYLLIPSTDEQKFMILEGEGGNGKSVYSAAITALLGQQNVSHIPLECFSKSFDLTETLSKLANIIGDVGELDSVAEGKLKSFTSGDPMFFDRKNLRGVHKAPTARLMMCCNNRPRFKDRSDGIARRMILVPFNVQIERHERVKGMDKPDWWLKTGEMPGIFCWAVAGLHRLHQQGDWTSSMVVRDAHEDFQIDMNPAKAFLRDHYTEDLNCHTPCNEVYGEYKRWISENGYRALSENSFGKEVARLFRRVTRKKKQINGVRVWAYHSLARCSGSVQDDDDEDEFSGQRNMEF